MLHSKNCRCSASGSDLRSNLRAYKRIQLPPYNSTAFIQPRGTSVKIPCNRTLLLLGLGSVSCVHESLLNNILSVVRIFPKWGFRNGFNELSIQIII